MAEEAIRCPLTGVVLAYEFGSRANEVFVELQKLLTPFGLGHCYTDAAGVYDHHLPAAAHTVGKIHPHSRSNATISRYGRGSSA